METNGQAGSREKVLTSAYALELVNSYFLSIRKGGDHKHRAELNMS